MFWKLNISISAAPTANKGDFRNEFDFLLIQQIEEKFKEIEHLLLRLSEQAAELEKTKKKELKEQILREITVSTNFADGADKFLKRQAARKDLDLLEKFNYDAAVISCELLVKDLAQLAAKVKKVET